jgi:hypothetical protein
MNKHLSAERFENTNEAGLSVYIFMVYSTVVGGCTGLSGIMKTMLSCKLVRPDSRRRN